MSNRNLGILAVVAVVMVGGAILQSRLSRPPRVAPSGPTFLIQGLDTSEIAGITIGHGSDAVRLTKKDGRFVVANKTDYPADAKQINDLISKCLDIRRSEQYTSNPENHEALEITEEDAHGLVKFLRPDGSLLTGVVVGKSQESGQGAFVRLAGSDDVFVAESAPWFRTTGIEYIDAELFAVTAEDVNSVTVSTPQGTYTLRPREDDTGAVMEDLPPDKTLKTSDARSVLTALTSLRFEDVNTPAAVGDLDFDRQYVCLLDNSTRYTLRLAKRGDRTYLQCEAAYTDTTPVTVKRGGNESEEELKKKEAKLLAQEHAQKFTLQHKGWVYQIPAWKANYLTKERADLLQDKPAEAKGEPAEAVETPAQGIPEPSATSDPNDSTAPVPEVPAPAGLPGGAAEPNEVPDPNAQEGTP